MGGTVVGGAAQFQESGLVSASIKKYHIMKKKIMLNKRMVIVLSPIAVSLLLICDIILKGPYAQIYNMYYKHLCDKNQLIGKPESVLVSILGRPSAVVADRSNGYKIYNYFPYIVFPTSKFQVVCIGGKVIYVEQFDD
jgi:hypothetical protein